MIEALHFTLSIVPTFQTICIMNTSYCDEYIAMLAYHSTHIHYPTTYLLHIFLADSNSSLIVRVDQRIRESCQRTIFCEYHFVGEYCYVRSMNTMIIKNTLYGICV